jgi:hypothetical protein
MVGWSNGWGFLRPKSSRQDVHWGPAIRDNLDTENNHKNLNLGLTSEDVDTRRDNLG